MANKQTKSLELEKYKPSEEVAALSEQLQAVIGYNPITHAFKLANAIGAVQQWMEHPEISRILNLLENTQGGFVTDKDPGVFYPPKVRTQAVLDALTNGIRINGNEFNIISGKMMVVQAGWKRLCDEMGHDVPGGFSPEANYKTVSLYTHDVGKPEMQGNLVVIKMVIEYELLNKTSGKVEKGTHEKDISITVKSRDTVDAWIGKAERRIYRDFFRKFSGKTIADVETDMLSGSPAGSGSAAAAGPVPPLGDQQKKPDPKKPSTEQAQPAVQAVPVQETEQPERPASPGLEAEDAEYRESTPEMGSAIDDLTAGPTPDAPPAPPEGSQTTLLPPDPPPARKAPAAPKAPAEPSATSKRPKTNF